MSEKGKVLNMFGKIPNVEELNRMQVESSLKCMKPVLEKYARKWIQELGTDSFKMSREYKNSLTGVLSEAVFVHLYENVIDKIKSGKLPTGQPFSTMKNISEELKERYKTTKE